MRIVLHNLALLVCIKPFLFFSPALADTQVYIEGGLGVAYTLSETEDVKISGDTDLEVSYGDQTNVSASGEIGLRGLIFDGFRLGLSLNYANVTGEVDSVSGTYRGALIDDATITEIKENSADAAQHSLLVFANAYYDFFQQGTLRPYIGLGLGFSSPVANEADQIYFAGQLIVGANHPINENLSIGLKYRAASGFELPFTNAVNLATNQFSPSSWQAHFIETSITYGF